MKSHDWTTGRAIATPCEWAPSLRRIAMHFAGGGSGRVGRPTKTCSSMNPTAQGRPAQ